MQSAKYPHPGGEKFGKGSADRFDFVPLIPPEQAATKLEAYREEMDRLCQEIEAITAEHDAIEKAEDAIAAVDKKIAWVGERARRNVAVRSANSPYGSRSEPRQSRAQKLHLETNGFTPELTAVDMSHETASSLDLYGVAPGDKRSFGYQCLLARRLVRRTNSGRRSRAMAFMCMTITLQYCT